jgi:RNA polymerase sigma-70 factor, ECF subfamily
VLGALFLWMNRNPATSAPPTDVERLYREQAGRLWRSLVAYCGDREMAADAVAEAFTLVMEQWGSIREPDRWVWRVAFRVATRELRRRRRAEVDVEPGQSHDLPEQSVDLVAALRRLSPNQRAAVVLHHYAGHPTKEVAAIIGSTAAAVRVHLLRGRRRLRDLLEERDD